MPQNSMTSFMDDPNIQSVPISIHIPKVSPNFHFLSRNKRLKIRPIDLAASVRVYPGSQGFPFSRELLRVPIAFYSPHSTLNMISILRAEACHFGYLREKKCNLGMYQNGRTNQ